MHQSRQTCLPFSLFQQVLCVAHSKTNFDGQPLEEGKELLAVVTKDSQQKGFFIRVVDPEVRGLYLPCHYDMVWA